MVIWIAWDESKPVGKQTSKEQMKSLDSSGSWIVNIQAQEELRILLHAA